MVTKVLFLLALFGVASSVFQRRTCDREPPRQTPTLCSNYENTEYLEEKQKELDDKQAILENRIDHIEGELEDFAITLASATRELEKIKNQTEAENRRTKALLEENKTEIASLKKDVEDLVNYKESVGGSFSEIERKLDATEEQLREREVKLANLESETEAALNHTHRVLNQYEAELSHLNTTAHRLGVRVEGRLNATTTDLDAKVTEIQRNSEGFSSELEKQKAAVDQFKEETGGHFRNVDQQLKAQNATVSQQKTSITTLKRDTAEIKHRLASTERNLQGEVDSIAAQVSTKVAFSASIQQSSGAFTGPGTAARKILIFNQVFTNVGGAYNNQTGIFTAPNKGVYHFTFMTFGYSCYTSGAMLLKNGHLQVSTYEFKGQDTTDTTSNTVILELNVGETVNIMLWTGGKVYTSVFSGFLVFPL
ncbi:Complement C1q-like protein 4 C1q and tumor necrosis factor-related protein 11 [Collichthys lucidus]|uniref:Complement C1q-like protein 4 C1q and tumor necrosis factor-related protein 11 n=1 Tax=Collichthys lucidus TaxID=240159 RepID=A0A4U5VWG8_COLLU|nr:Complement C1q-like protein 4 C1q and tumor necrosis factor-related protein 11 [Collichthys lucidus]